MKTIVAVIIGILIGAGALMMLGPNLPASPFSRPLAEVRPPAIPALPAPAPGSQTGSGTNPALTAGDAPIVVY